MILKFMWKNKCSTVVKESKKKQNGDRRCISQGPVGTLVTYPKPNSKESNAGVVYRDMGRAEGPTSPH